MKLNVFILFLGLWAIGSSSAFAAGQTIEEASGSQIPLLGQPIKNDATGESIALGCKEFQGDVNHCTRLQFVSFFKSSAFYFGPEFKVDETESLDTALQRIYKQVKQELKRNAKSWEKSRLVILGVAGGGFYGLIKIALVSAASSTIMLGSLGLLAAVTVLSNKGSSIDVFGGHNAATAFQRFNATRETNGWNWASRNKHLSHRKFFVTKYTIQQLGQRFFNESMPIQVRLKEHTDAACRVRIDGSLTGDEHRSLGETGTKVSGTDALTAMDALHLMSELARERGCALAFEGSAQYSTSIRQEFITSGAQAQQARAGGYSLTMNDLGTGDVVFSKSITVRFSSMPFQSNFRDEFKQDRRMMQSFE